MIKSPTLRKLSRTRYVPGGWLISSAEASSRDILPWNHLGSTSATKTEKQVTSKNKLQILRCLLWQYLFFFFLSSPSSSFITSAHLISAGAWRVYGFSSSSCRREANASEVKRVAAQHSPRAESRRSAPTCASRSPPQARPPWRRVPAACTKVTKPT